MTRTKAIFLKAAELVVLALGVALAIAGAFLILYGFSQMTPERQRFLIIMLNTNN
jgi:hypothetical protein